MHRVSSEWEQQAQESYDRVALPYAQATRAAIDDNLHMFSDYSRLAALAHAACPDDAVVVDIGCGPGWWVQHLADQGLPAVGIDLSPTMVDIARANVPHARFETGSIVDIPIPSECAAGVCCMFVLHHLPDDDLGQALGELVRLLKPGGVLLLGGHVGTTRTVKTTGYGGHPMNVLINKRPAAELAGAVRHAGLKIEAHTIYDPDSPTATHALFARREPL